MFESVMDVVFFWLAWNCLFAGFVAESLSLRLMWQRIKTRYPDAKFNDYVAWESFFSSSKRYPFGEPWVMDETKAAAKRTFVIAVLAFGGFIWLGLLADRVTP